MTHYKIYYQRDQETETIRLKTPNNVDAKLIQESITIFYPELRVYHPEKIPNFLVEGKEYPIFVSDPSVYLSVSIA